MLSLTANPTVSRTTSKCCTPSDHLSRRGSNFANVSLGVWVASAEILPVLEQLKMHSLTALALLGSVATAQEAGGMSPTASISQGMVIGTTTMLPAATAPVNKFLGVPFAMSPPLRFAPPSAPVPFDGPLMAQTLRPACIQQFVCKWCTLRRSYTDLESPISD